MRKANTIRGRIEQHGQGLGTPDAALLERRAREIAVTNGRRAEDFNQADLTQAREELQDSQKTPPETVEDEQEEVAPREGPIVSSGRAARTRVPADEQTLPEDLVEEGVEEATHEHMVEGNKQSRRRDENFEDQLPAAGE
jgi:hypothetical protein